MKTEFGSKAETTMPLFELNADGISPIKSTSFSAERVAERADLQRILRDQIEIVAPNSMVLAEEFCDWEDSRRRIDLLCLDKDANLVVVELKRGDDGGHIDLQAIRYAAMVSRMTFDQAVLAHEQYRERRGSGGDAREEILTFLGWNEPDEEEFAADVRIVLVAADFSREVTTSVLWLNDRDLDIRCVQLLPYRIAGRLVLDVQQVLPLPEAQEFQVRVRGKERAERQARASSRDNSRFEVSVFGEVYKQLPKRGAILAIVQALCRNGASPADIAAATEINPKRLWFDVDGICDAESFAAQAGLIDAAGRRNFSPRRWHSKDDQLIHHEDRTYALSDQWGTQTLPAIDALARHFPAAGISYSRNAAPNNDEAS